METKIQMTEIIQIIVLSSVLVLIVLMLITILTLFFVAKAPYVPSQKKMIKSILDSIQMKKNAKLYDLGCGDGRFLIQAEKTYQIKGIGFEISIIPYLFSILFKKIEKSDVQIHFANFYKKNLSDADYIFCYLYPEMMEKVAEKIKKECKKGTKLISNTFSIKNMQPSKVIAKNKNQKQNIYIYEF
ncbi:hypothetical protein GF376_03025 [Candidatus Peregrinibacteria bacterium]|nr:hypothetical protein [Candidatus Peregrinibacteria bacterium]